MDPEFVRVRLGWNRKRQEELESLDDPALIAGRVAVEHREAYGLVGCEVDTARLSGRFRREAAAWPAVGDWVAIVPAEGGGGIIHHLLPRTSVLERKRPLVVQVQTVAANVDVVFVVTSAELAASGLTLADLDRNPHLTPLAVGRDPDGSFSALYEVRS